MDPATGAIVNASLGVVPSLRTTLDAIASGPDGKVYVVANPVTGASYVAVRRSGHGATGRVACTLPGLSRDSLTVLPDGGVLGLVQLNAATPFRCDPATGAVALLPPLPTTLQSWSPLTLAGDGLLFQARLPPDRRAVASVLSASR